MKNLSAKLKLTVWNSLLMVLMASIVMGLILSFSDDIIATNSKTTLINVVDDNTDELEFEDGMLEIDDIDFFKNSVYTLLYSQEGERIAGTLPEEFLNEPPLQDKGMAKIAIDGTVYYIYDRLGLVEDSDILMWVRGVTAVDKVGSATNSILQTTLFSLPIFILLAAIGCYFIAKHTFRPIDKIIHTAEEISSSENLSLRINLKNGDTEIHNLSNAFDKMFERLESAFEAEKQFSQNVSHELRTPTAVILAQCEYTLESNTTDKDRQEALEVIQRQAKKISRLIADLLSLIRLERGIEKPEFVNIDLSELVTFVCEEQNVIAPKNTTFNYNIMPNITLNANHPMMIILVTNLVSNAFRYRKEKGNISVILTENDAEIILSISDDGIGIAKENQTKLWQRFYQVDSSRTANHDGNTGLGLSMVAQIVKLHGAKIRVESELGKGSCFTVNFQK